MNKRNIGSLYEEKAVEYLKDNGFTVIVKNFRCPKGEIDIIAIKEDILRFIEVKYRKNTEYGYAKEAVNKTKMNKIYNSAMWFITCNPVYSDTQCSFDVISIQGDNIEYIFNSFNSF